MKNIWTKIGVVALVFSLMAIKYNYASFANATNMSKETEGYTIERFEHNGYEVCKYTKKGIEQRTVRTTEQDTDDKIFDIEVTKALLVELNFSEKMISNLSEEELYHLSQCGEIYTATTYIIGDNASRSFGNVPLPDLVDPSPGPLESEVTVDSYQRITITLYDDPDSNATKDFMVTASAEWIRMPIFRLMDAFGITGVDISLINDENGYPKAEGFYSYTRYGEETENIRYDFLRNDLKRIYKDIYYGVGVQFVLPGDDENDEDDEQTYCDNFYVYLKAHIEMGSPGLITNTKFIASYFHSYIQLSVQPSIVIGDSISGAISLTGTQSSETRYVGIDYTYRP